VVCRTLNQQKESAQMARFAMTGSIYNLTLDRDMIDVTCERDTLDSRWRGTDSNGHEHRGDRLYDTLELIVDAEHWCEGNEGWGRHDPHMHVDEAHYECRQCRESVEPGVVTGGTPQYIAGVTTATLEGRRSDGTKITAILTSEQTDQVRTLMDADAAGQQLFIDAIPDEQIVHREFSR
jgi:hypothetical protein